MRVALLVGVNNYQQDPLGNCISDARKMEAALSTRGFLCRRVDDPTAAEVDEALEAFAKDAADATLAFVYLAGHGVEHHGAGYFLAADFPFPVSASKLQHCAIAMPRIIGSMPNKQTSKFVVADMCRNWPASHGTDLLQQLDELRKEEVGFENLIVGYSTSAGDTASDGAGTSSSYCDAFCEALLDHSLTFDTVFHRVGDKVIASSGRLQRPWHYSSMRATGSFSDLKKLSLLNAVSTPLKGHGLPLFVSKLRNQDGIFVSGMMTSAWQVTTDGLRNVRPSFESPVLCIGHLRKNRCAILLEDGTLNVFDEKSGQQVYSGQSLDRPSMMMTSPSSNMVVVCADEKAEIHIFQKTRLKRCTTSMSSTIHCGLILSDDHLWLAGGLGYLLKARIRSKTKTLSTKEFNFDRSNINFLTKSLVSDEVVVVGSGGTVRFLSLRPSELRTMHLGDRVRTPRAIRESLVDYADADNISKALAEPSATREDVRAFLIERIPGTQLLWCDVSPTQPLLAVASAEGLVFILDIRDGRHVQTIDLWMGAGNTPHGMAFLGDGTLAILLADGLVVFYGELAMMENGLEGAWVATTSAILNLSHVRHGE
ncbi:caspase family protein [Rhizobium laguerreae]|uniref:caspase family protein n=1 Tax=Rhizobium laguerreae TaxID=1076926 RepID=UPI0028A7CBB5|nr:caspase family protein [Rhizobium laguerreae]